MPMLNELMGWDFNLALMPYGMLIENASQQVLNKEAPGTR